MTMQEEEDIKGAAAVFYAGTYAITLKSNKNKETHISVWLSHIAGTDTVGVQPARSRGEID